MAFVVSENNEMELLKRHSSVRLQGLVGCEQCRDEGLYLHLEISVTSIFSPAVTEVVDLLGVFLKV